MRIAFIHPRYPFSEGTGATHSATQIVTGLSDLGHDVDVYCPRKPNVENIPPEINLYHLSGNSSHPHTDTRLNKELKARLSKFEDYDIVHSYLMSLIPAIGKIGKEVAVGTVVTLNAYGGICAKNDLLYKNENQCEEKSTLKCLNCITRTGISSGSNSYPYETASQLLSLRQINNGEEYLEFIDGFRAPSGHVRDNYTQFGYDAEKISVIPHPIDEEFLTSHQSDFSEPYELLYVGALEHHKGVQKLIPIVSALLETETEFTLTIVGTGGLEDSLREQAEEYGVTDEVNFTGFISNDDLPEVYANHDCFVYPGIWEEPLGRVYLESLSAGTPIVTSEYGSIGEIVGDAGRLTDGSVDEFRSTLQQVVKENQLEAMSSAAKDQASRFELSSIVNDLEEVYRTVRG